MAPSTYDVNVQLALATTAEHEGDLDTALDFLAQAHRLGREGRSQHPRPGPPGDDGVSSADARAADARPVRVGVLNKCARSAAHVVPSNLAGPPSWRTTCVSRCQADLSRAHRAALERFSCLGPARAVTTLRRRRELPTRSRSCVRQRDCLQRTSTQSRTSSSVAASLLLWSLHTS